MRLWFGGSGHNRRISFERVETGALFPRTSETAWHTHTHAATSMHQRCLPSCHQTSCQCSRVEPNASSTHVIHCSARTVCGIILLYAIFTCGDKCFVHENLTRVIDCTARTGCEHRVELLVSIPFFKVDWQFSRVETSALFHACHRLLSTPLDGSCQHAHKVTYTFQASLD